MIPALEAESLSIAHESGRFVVSDVSFAVAPTQVMALTGESGSGKSLTALSFLRLLPNALRISSGAVRVLGTDLANASPIELRRIRGGDVGWIPQDPLGSLNPAMTIGAQIRDVLKLAGVRDKNELQVRTAGLLRAVRLNDAQRFAAAYPHQLSGGQAQRACIARAIARGPRVLIADEPTTSLDAKTSRDIIDLLDAIRVENGMSMLWVTHDLWDIHERADVVAVMYAGRIVEMGRPGEVLARPRHPYTQALLASSPSMLPADAPIPIGAFNEDPPASGCALAPRCALATPACAAACPQLTPHAPGWLVACHNAERCGGTRA